MLGTSGSTPVKDRGMPSIVVSCEGYYYMFDCGEGTQMQMLKYKINPSKIKCIFISHIHGDHVLGIAGLVRTMAINNRSSELYIFLPKGYENALESTMTFDKALIKYPIKITGMKNGSSFKDRNIQVKSFSLNHSIETLGYSISEYDKRNFIKEKCDKLGIKGNIFSKLSKKKRININGKIINLDAVTILHKGKKIVYATDTRPTANTVKAAMNCDLLIHEATYADNEEKLANERKHSTAAEAAKIAKSAKAKRLLLTHISARYKDDSELLKQARKIFKNTEIAEDGQRIEFK
jgi:ribonuclease Z